jgi:ABC-type phosphate/phosphonate transport system permease subunit
MNKRKMLFRSINYIIVLLLLRFLYILPIAVNEKIPFKKAFNSEYFTPMEPYQAIIKYIDNFADVFIDYVYKSELYKQFTERFSTGKEMAMLGVGIVIVFVVISFILRKYKTIEFTFIGICLMPLIIYSLFWRTRQFMYLYFYIFSYIYKYLDKVNSIMPITIFYVILGILLGIITSFTRKKNKNYHM